MLPAKKPCRQLNSEAIKSAALCYLTPIISGKCTIISARCVCNVNAKTLPKAWSSICKKCDACDRAISVKYLFEECVFETNFPPHFQLLKHIIFFFIQDMPNIAFFSSAISTREKKKVSIIEETAEESSLSEKDENLSPIPSATTEQWLDGSLASINKSLFPAISYWVALTTRNGAPASSISVHKALINVKWMLLHIRLAFFPRKFGHAKYV